jgi:prepilin-type N-terminal cleavage/methylation domain-containing protein
MLNILDERTGKISNKRQKPGVTLIELLIVVIILAMLSAIAIPRMLHSAASTKIQSCRSNIYVINSAIEQYYSDNAAYPADLPDVTQNSMYFPDGEPICPVTQNPYSYAAAQNRVDATTHNH